MWNMRKVPLAVLWLFACMHHVTGQQLAAYWDNQNHFYIFDDGTSRQVEYLPVKSYQVGGTCILYINSQNRLKMYYNGKTSTLEQYAAGHYEALDYLAVYSFAGTVKVIENGAVGMLGTNIAQYLAEDSLVVYYDKGEEWLAAYYKKSTVVLEDGLAGRSFDGLAAGDNLVAWVSALSNSLKVFYQGRITVVDPFFSGSRYKAGRDILVYISEADRKFRVFYQGSQRVLEEFPPASFEVGDGIVAYVDHVGRFKVFSNGSVQEISSFAPEFYSIRNRIILFAEQGYFKTWYKEQTYVLEHYVPADWKASWNTIVYWDMIGNLKVFRDGVNKILTYDLVEEVQLFRDIIVVNKGMNNCDVYYKGQQY
jgi:hypothetical protein